MGKNNRTSSKTYVHKIRHNPRARESVERKTIALQVNQESYLKLEQLSTIIYQNIEIKRLQGNVANQRENLENYLSADDREFNAKAAIIGLGI